MFGDFIAEKDDVHEEEEKMASKVECVDLDDKMVEFLDK